MSSVAGSESSNAKGRTMAFTTLVLVRHGVTEETGPPEPAIETLASWTWIAPVWIPPDPAMLSQALTMVRAEQALLFAAPERHDHCPARAHVAQAPVARQQAPAAVHRGPRDRHASRDHISTPSIGGSVGHPVLAGK